MYSIIDLHDRILFYLLIILFVVVWFLVSTSMNLKYHLAHLHHSRTLFVDKLNHNHLLLLVAIALVFTLNLMAFWVVMVFVIILTIGFYYEWFHGALVLPRLSCGLCGVMIVISGIVAVYLEF